MLLQVGPDRVQEDGPHDPEVGVWNSRVVVEAAQVHQVGLRLKSQEQVDQGIILIIMSGSSCCM